MASSSESPSLSTASRRRRVRAWHVGLDLRVLPGGADRDVHDVRRAAAAPQDRHRERRPERGLLPLCPEIRGGIAEGRPVRRGARDGGLGGEPATCWAGRLGRGGRHRSERRGQPRGDHSTSMPWAACTTSPCGSSTAATSGSIASVSSRASASASVRRAAVPTPSPCSCSPSTA